MFGLKTATKQVIEQPTELEILGLKEIELATLKLKKVDELRRAELAAGEHYLESPLTDVGSDTHQVIRLQAEIAAIDRAILLLRTRRPEIIYRGFVVRANELQREAREKRSEGTALELKASALLGQLAEIEGSAYAPTGTPRSSFLRASAEALERSAAELTSQEMPSTGTVDLEAVAENEQVLRAVLKCPALGPTIEQIREWLDACDDSAQKSRAASFEGHPRRVFLSWTAEGIDLKQSYVFCGALAAKHKDDSGTIDVGSGTFRAGVLSVISAWPGAPAPVESSRGWYRA